MDLIFNSTFGVMKTSRSSALVRLKGLVVLNEWCKSYNWKFMGVLSKILNRSYPRYFWKWWFLCNFLLNLTPFRRPWEVKLWSHAMLISRDVMVICAKVWHIMVHYSVIRYPLWPDFYKQLVSCHIMSSIIVSGTLFLVRHTYIFTNLWLFFL